MIVAVEPRSLRKAAAFVEKIAELEKEFGVRLQIPQGEKVSFTLDQRPLAPFVIVRNPKGVGELALGLDAS